MPTSVDTPVGSPASVVTPEPTEQLPALSQSFNVTDKDGYSFTITVDYATIAIRNEPAAELPGFTSAQLDLRLEVTVTNTTSQRTLTFEPWAGVIAEAAAPGFALVQVFPKGSAVCMSQEIETDCIITVAHAKLTGSSNQIPAGGQVTPTAWNGDGLQAAGVAQIPEASFDAVRESLLSPAGYFLAYGGQDYERFDDVCLGGPARVGATIHVAATAGACGDQQRLFQPLP